MPSYTGLSPSSADLPRSFHSLYISFWAPPLSLATTYGITIVLFSSGYLDVSVLRVLFRLAADDRSSICRVAPFGHLRINARLQLPVAFRSLPRPSSSLRAKASTIRPYLLPILKLILSSGSRPTHFYSRVSTLFFFSKLVNELFLYSYILIFPIPIRILIHTFSLFISNPFLLNESFLLFCGG